MKVKDIPEKIWVGFCNEGVQNRKYLRCDDEKRMVDDVEYVRKDIFNRLLSAENEELKEHVKYLIDTIMYDLRHTSIETRAAARGSIEKSLKNKPVE